MSLVEQAPPRPSIVTRGRSWARGLQLSGLAVVIAAAAVLGYWWAQRSDASPADAAHRFLTSTSCSRLHTLASDAGDRALHDVGCASMVAAARGQRTYGSAQTRLLTRTLRVDHVSTSGDTAQVTIDVSYAGVAPREVVGVQLSQVGHGWRVDDWGLATR